MEKKFKTRVRLMEMARRNRATRIFLSSRENPQMRLGRLNGWVLPDEERETNLNLAPAGQMTLWTNEELPHKNT